MNKNSGYDLLEIKERFKTNLSSKQYVVILNKMINLACKPLFLNVPYMRELVLQSILQTQDDHRRKISVHDKQKTLFYLINAVSQNDYSFIEECELNRSILFLAASKTLEVMEGVEELEANIILKKNRAKSLADLKSMERVLGIKYNCISPIYKWCKFHLDNYRNFRSMVVEKYTRYAYNESVAALSITGLHISLKDLYMNYIGAVEKAIDKCDAGKGTLTSYIQQWMLSARSNPEFDHQVGVAYDIPASVIKDYKGQGKKLSNMSQELKLNLNEEDEQYKNKIDSMFAEDDDLIYAMRGIKDSKLLFMVLGLVPRLTEEELAKLAV